MHRDVEAADQMLSKLSDLLRIALDQRGRAGSGAQGRARVPAEVPRDRAGAVRRPALGGLHHRAADAGRAGAEPYPAATRRKQCSPRGRRAHRAGPHRRQGPPERRSPGAVGPRQRAGPAEGAHRRRRPPASAWPTRARGSSACTAPASTSRSPSHRAAGCSSPCRCPFKADEVAEIEDLPEDVKGVA